MEAEAEEKSKAQRPIYTHIKLLDREFQQLGDFIHSTYGIKMPPAKTTMLEARLQKRLRALGIISFKKYLEYLFSPEGLKDELVEMINVVTTNKTDFFREPLHFDFLVEKALPELIDLHGAGIKRPLAFWSAGCSTGEEPYSAAMVLNEFARKIGNFRFTLLASDISSRVLERAITGVYDEEKVDPVPPHLKKKYLMRSKDRSSRLVRVVPELRSIVKFRRLNFMEGDFGMREMMDVIFCRNVIIYFDRPTQEKLLNRLAGHIVPGGYIFMGHSETLNGLDVPFFLVAPTVYRKRL